ncbi:MAG: hypothetical protein FH748_14690 [Balneolaceae bacterium]|nr:hypothetical protein [Balneolaceae bacterium]
MEAPERDTTKIELETIADLDLVANNIESNFKIEHLLDMHNSQAKLNHDKLEKLEEVLKPLVQKGNDYRKKIVENSTENNQYLKDLENLSDEELAMVGFLSLFEKEMENKKRMKVAGNIDGGRIMSCLSIATGYSSIKAVLDVSGLMSARTLIAAVKAIGKRYLGYIGVAILVYSFADCMGAFE